MMGLWIRLAVLCVFVAVCGCGGGASVEIPENPAALPDKGPVLAKDGSGASKAARPVR